MAIDTIIFDLGGVLVQGSDRRQLFNALGLPYAAEELEAWKAYRAGHITQREYWTKVLERTPFAGLEDRCVEGAAAFWAAIPEAFAMPYLEPLHQKGYRLAILSNHSRDWVAGILLRHGALRLYCNPILVSAEMGVAKPDLAAFHRALDAVSRKDNPCSCLFIDDQFENVASARKAGMKAERCADKEALLAALDGHAVRL